MLIILSNTSLNAQHFSEESKQRGINHAYRDKVLTGGGAAFFDFDNDGDDDLYLTGGLGRDQLYKNDGTGQFTQMPSSTTGFTQTIQYNTLGVSTGDIDNDGFRDIFICTWDYRNDLHGPNLLFRNNGDGTFEDISESAGIIGNSYSTSSTFFDFDKDGLLDIYVVNHLQEAAFVRDSTGLVVGYDHKCFENYFYRNNGDLTFTEMAAEVGLNSVGCGLVVVATDIDFDKDPDLYVANDFGEFVVANELFVNQYPEKEFEDRSEQSQANIGLYGMGIAIGDYDQDLDMDFYVTNIGRNSLIENTNGIFKDVTVERGVENIIVPSEGLNTTGWGTQFLDVDNDTWLDLFVANGRIPALSINATAERDPNKLYLNNGDRTFTDVSEIAGIDDQQKARGFVSSDIDGDGDLDLLTVVLEDISPDAHSKLYINQSDNNHNFIQFKLQGVESNRDAYGAMVWLYAGTQVFLKEIYGGGASYASQSSSVLHFGLADIDKVDSLKISWPNGHQQSVINPAINQLHSIIEDVDLSTTIEEIPINSVQIYPNPFDGNFSISLNQPSSEDVAIELLTIHGQVIDKQVLKIGNRELKFTDLNNLQRGMYLLRFSTIENNFGYKMLKITR